MGPSFRWASGISCLPSAPNKSVLRHQTSDLATDQTHGPHSRHAQNAMPRDQFHLPLSNAGPCGRSHNLEHARNDLRCMRSRRRRPPRSTAEFVSPQRRPPEPCACPLRARSEGNRRSIAVTRGQAFSGTTSSGTGHGAGQTIFASRGSAVRARLAPQGRSIRTADLISTAAKYSSRDRVRCRTSVRAGPRSRW
jgi:hypothetical protein